MPRDTRNYLTASPLILGLIVIDLAFIAIHMWLWSRASVGYFSLSRDGGYPEMFNYLKWALCAGACLYAFLQRRKFLFLAWGLLFSYLLLDDLLELHESGGQLIATAMEWGPAFGLRGKDFGEVVASLGAGALLLGTIAVAYRSTKDREARAFARQLLPWLALLVFCGIGLDMFHSYMGKEPPLLAMLLVVLEDGGEMIAGSFLTAVSVNYALSVRVAMSEEAGTRPAANGASWRRNPASSHGPAFDAPLSSTAAE